MRNDIAVVTMTTKFDRGVYAFLDSCEKFRISPIILGWGLQWLGCCHKLHVFLDALEEIKKHKKTVLFVDAYDSVFVDDIDSIMSEYDSIGHPLIYSAEKTCFPNPGKGPFHPESTTPWRYLNAGGIIGECENVYNSLLFLRQINWNWWSIDQDYIMDYMFQNPNAIMLDTECRIFQNLHDSHSALELGDKVKNIVTNRFPKVIHGNGRADMSSLENWIKKDRTPAWKY